MQQHHTNWPGAYRESSLFGCMVFLGCVSRRRVGGKKVEEGGCETGEGRGLGLSVLIMDEL